MFEALIQSFNNNAAQLYSTSVQSYFKSSVESTSLSESHSDAPVSLVAVSFYVAALPLN
jgi:hypothetical protein